MLKAARLLLLIAGAVVTGWLLWVHGPAVLGALAQVGWGGVALYLLASLVLYALDAWAWKLVLPAGEPRFGIVRLFSIRMAGEAVNKVTPLASIGGEPLKAYLLARGGRGLGESLASVAIAKNVMTVAQIAFIFAGLALALPRLSAHTGLVISLALFPAAVLSGMVITAVVDWRLRRGRKREESPPPERPPGRLRRMGAATLTLWADVADFFWTRPRECLASLLFFFLGWAAGALELLAAAAALGLHLSPLDALAMEAMLVSVNMATFFIPANAGAQEGGFALLSPLWGLTTPQGVAMAVLRRCRDAVWVAFGLLYLLGAEGRLIFAPSTDPAQATRSA